MNEDMDGLVENTDVRSESERQWQPTKKGNEDVEMSKQLNEAISNRLYATPVDSEMEDETANDQKESQDSCALEFPDLDEGHKARQAILSKQTTLEQLANMDQSEHDCCA